MIKNIYLKTIIRSILAALLICLGGAIYLACENKIVGSCLFSIGLISVIVLQADLFTGKIGYLNKNNWLQIIIILLVNLLTAFLLGMLYQAVYGAQDLYLIKLEKPSYQIFLDSIICGILIYLAVEIYKRIKNIIPVIICVMSFILCGAEHSIADMFYFGASSMSWYGFGIIWLIVLGNAIGSLSIHALQLFYEEK